MSKINIKICKRCVMDSTDPAIKFDNNGFCNYCSSYLEQDFSYHPSKEQQLQTILSEIKEYGKDKKYDCLIGLSGGVDSSYVAYEVKRRGLRPLAIHLDNGWNSELAESNMRKCVEKLNIDLITYKVDWDEFKDIQKSFLKASIPGMEIPTDHALITILNRTAIENDIRYIINGSNNSSEYIMSPRWSEGDGQRDGLLVKTIQKKFGTKRLKTFPRTTIWENFSNKLKHKLVIVNILNYIDYSKEKGKALIEKELDWVYYGGKHYESIYTRFTQAYIQPEKFNIDKRKAHHSNLICAGEMTREEALSDLQKSAYPNPEMLEEDRQLFIKKLDMTEDEFVDMMNAPVKSFLNYRGYYNHPFYKVLYNLAFGFHNILKKVNYYGKSPE